jgi:hypothetical protein
MSNKLLQLEGLAISEPSHSRQALLAGQKSGLEIDSSESQWRRADDANDHPVDPSVSVLPKRRRPACAVLDSTIHYSPIAGYGL